jgi:hypothetical protein
VPDRGGVPFRVLPLRSTKPDRVARAAAEQDLVDDPPHPCRRTAATAHPASPRSCGPAVGDKHSERLLGLLANITFLRYDPACVTSLGELLSAVVGLADSRVWEVCPLNLPRLLVRLDLARSPWVLIVPIAGTVVGLLVNLVGLTRALAHRATSR